MTSLFLWALGYKFRFKRNVNYLYTQDIVLKYVIVIQLIYCDRLLSSKQIKRYSFSIKLEVHNFFFVNMKRFFLNNIILKYICSHGYFWPIKFLFIFCSATNQHCVSYFCLLSLNQAYTGLNLYTGWKPHKGWGSSIERVNIENIMICMTCCLCLRHILHMPLFIIVSYIFSLSGNCVSEY